VSTAPIAEMPPQSRGAELVRMMRLHPDRAWLETRPEPVILALAVALGLGLCQLPGGRPFSKLELIDQILAAEWERTRK